MGNIGGLERVWLVGLRLRVVGEDGELWAKECGCVGFVVQRIKKLLLFLELGLFCF